MAWAEGQWEGAWAAVKAVWASKWNERAVLSLRRAGLSPTALQMAVLCQEVVPAAYSFVAHTTHPTTGAPRCYLFAGRCPLPCWVARRLCRVNGISILQAFMLSLAQYLFLCKMVPS